MTLVPQQNMASCRLVVNEGTVTTSGDGAHGILAYTISGTGRAGKDSCTFCSAPSAGGPGADGGMVSVENNGAIVTEYATYHNHVEFSKPGMEFDNSKGA